MNYYIFFLTTANVCVTDVIQNEREFANEAKTERTVTQRDVPIRWPKRDDINKNNDDDANTYIGWEGGEKKGAATLESLYTLIREWSISVPEQTDRKK